MTQRLFTIESHSMIDKSFSIEGPDGFAMMVDYDDVDHEFVDLMTDAVVETLNTNWSMRTLIEMAKTNYPRPDSDGGL